VRATARKIEALFPFPVPPAFDKALKTAAARVDALSSETWDAAGRVQKRVATARHEAKRIGQEIQTRVSDAAEVLVEKTLHRLNVPSRSELKTLMAKVDALGRKIDTLAGTRRPARRRRAG